jgi:hypothetical protein
MPPFIWPDTNHLCRRQGQGGVSPVANRNIEENHLESQGYLDNIFSILPHKSRKA